MKVIQTKTLIETIGTIFEKSERKNLSNMLLQELEEELKIVSKFCNITSYQALFFSVICALNFEDRTADASNLARHFGCKSIEIMAFNDDLEDLINRKILISKRFRSRFRVNNFGNRFYVNYRIMEAIIKGEEFPDFKPIKLNNVFEVLGELEKLDEERKENEQNFPEFMTDVEEILQVNKEIPLIKKVLSFHLKELNTYFYLMLVWDELNGDTSVSLNRKVGKLIDNPSKRARLIRDIITGKNALVKRDLAETKPARFFGDVQIALTDHSHEILKEIDIDLSSNQHKGKSNVIRPEEIIERKLVFDPQGMKQIFSIKDLMRPEKFNSVKEELKKKGLPAGITVLLHGVPGTGKTEVVKQLARTTNREIMKVEISQTKSSWFGQSEKLVKNIFLDYQELKEESKMTPILLFNEADAIISSRKDIGSSNVAQTENAMQNILLEELENFEGILFATTNLIDNLDKAFDRRFLFKVPFEKPTTEIRAKIWQLKLPKLTKLQALQLAERFTLTGGQIDNVARKKAIKDVLENRQIEFKGLIEFCEQETREKVGKMIGF